MSWTWEIPVWIINTQQKRKKKKGWKKVWHSIYICPRIRNYKLKNAHFDHSRVPATVFFLFGGCRWANHSWGLKLQRRVSNAKCSGIMRNLEARVHGEREARRLCGASPFGTVINTTGSRCTNFKHHTHHLKVSKLTQQE